MLGGNFGIAFELPAFGVDNASVFEKKELQSSLLEEKPNAKEKNENQR